MSYSRKMLITMTALRATRRRRVPEPVFLCPNWEDSSPPCRTGARRAPRSWRTRRSKTKINLIHASKNEIFQPFREAVLRHYRVRKDLPKKQQEGHSFPHCLAGAS